MPIDWDQIAEEAAETPRAVLARWLTEADDITTLVVIVEKSDADSVQAATRYVSYETSGTGMAVTGLLQYASDQHRDSIRRSD